MPSQKAKKICKESKMTKAEIKILTQEYISTVILWYIVSTHKIIYERNFQRK